MGTSKVNGAGKMHSRPAGGAVMAAGLLLLAAAGCEDRSGQSAGARQEGTRKDASGRYDREYLRALAAANEFCHYWRKGSFADGMALVTDRLAGRYPEQRLAMAIAGGGHPVHAGFEIFGGRRIEAPVDPMVMARQADGVWLVDEFRVP